MHSQKIGHHLPLLHAIWGLETNEFKQFELANGNILRRIIYLHAESPVTTSILDRGDVNIPAEVSRGWSLELGGVAPDCLIAANMKLIKHSIN